jgi:very-short-patch-repair endonuclease
MGLVVGERNRDEKTLGFVEKAWVKHGKGKWGYERAEYGQNNTVKVDIFCNVCQELFQQTPMKHLAGQGHRPCSLKAAGVSRRKRTENFILEAKKVHGGKYSYTKSSYTVGKENIIITCPDHGEFFQRASHHLDGHGCSDCSGGVQKTHRQFLIDARKTHEDAYSYPEEYVNSKTRLKIICNEHGEFKQSPKKHVKGQGCPFCAGHRTDKQILNSGAQKTHQQFLNSVGEVHGNTYSYPEEYVNNKTKMRITCKEHGDFNQTPGSHLAGNGCPLCSGGTQRTHQQFLNSVRKVHGNTYSYPEEYVDNKTKLRIVCKKHGEFKQTPAGHLAGQGCSQCGKQRSDDSKRKSLKKFISDAVESHGDLYDYSLVDYISTHSKVIITCKKKDHREFPQTPDSHLRGSGCPKCIGRNRTTKEFIEAAKITHGEVYDYKKTHYRQANRKVKIKCRKHGMFKQLPGDHVKGNGCPICKSSHGERLVYTILTNHKIEFERQKRFQNCVHKKCLPFDFFLPSFSPQLLIEYDGIQHFKLVEYWGGQEALEQIQYRDAIKTKFAKDNGYTLLRIRYDENIKEKLLPYIQ